MKLQIKMKLSKEDLQSIEDFAGMLISIHDIAVILEKDVDDFISEYKDSDSSLYKAYMKGFLLTKASLNKSIIELASRNSSPAQTEALRMIKQITYQNSR